MKKESEPVVQIKTEEKAKLEDVTKSPVKPAPTTEETQKETTPKKEKDPDEKVRNIQIG